MKKAIIYCRVSTAKQENNGDSLNNQEKACRTYCKNNSIQVVGVFKESFTGKKKSRPIFDEAINNAIDNKIDYFIVFDIDRFSREGYGAYSELKNNLYKNGISLKDSKNIIGDTNTVMKNDIVDMKQYHWNIETSSKYAEVMIATQAEIEGKKIIQRTIPREIDLEQLGYHVRQSNFGYINKKIRTGNGRVTIQEKHPIEGEWILEIFNKRAKGYHTDQEIVDELNRKSYLSRAGKQLTVKQLQMYIKMPVYAGVISSKWTGYKAIRTAYKGLIDVNTWNQANRGKIQIIEIDNKEVKIEYNKYKEERIEHPIIEKRKNYNPDYLYAKALKCPKCSGVLTPNTSTSGNGSLHHYYQCKGKNGAKHRNYTAKREETHIKIQDVLSNICINDDILELYDKIVDEVFQERQVISQKNNVKYKEVLKGLEKKENEIIKNIDKVIEFPILLKAKNQELEEIKSEKFKLELKKNQTQNITSLDKFKYYSKKLITQVDQLATQKDNPELISIAFDIIFDGRVEVEKINCHTNFFHSFGAKQSHQKNPQSESFSENLNWQAH